VDIWSAGCVILEMLNGDPLFIGDTSVNHLIEIIKVLGTPTQSEVIAMNPEYDIRDYNFPKIKKKEWNEVIIYRYRFFQCLTLY
jgi:glycogen synthase kinase 3 beta